MGYDDLAFTIFQEGRVDDAIAMIKKSLAINPDYAESHYNLSRALAQKGQMDETE